MKIRFWIIVCFCSLWMNPPNGAANSNSELIEQFPSGEINWTRGVVTAKGIAEPLDKTVDNTDNSDQVSRQALEQAARNVIETLMQLRVDAGRCTSNLFQVNKIALPKVEEMALASKVLSSNKMPSGGEEVFIQMSLFGGFAQLMLPAEIQQVDPIKPLNGQSNNHGFGDRDIEAMDADLEKDAFTGLIVDARGTGARPSMVPVLLDENGQVVFGPAYISREFAVQHGICQYFRLMSDGWAQWPRVAPKPLLVKGLRTDTPGSCNIIISNADASKLRGASSHVMFLKQCRVIIVLD